MKKIALLITAVVAFGCTDAEQSKMGGLGDKFSVELVNCDGTITHKWISSGKVLSENGSDGYYFMEDKTDKLVEVTGTLIITKQ
jgi:hypothetical protein